MTRETQSPLQLGATRELPIPPSESKSTPSPNVSQASTLDSSHDSNIVTVPSHHEGDKKPSGCPETWTIDDVTRWLKGKGFNKDVYDRFTANDIDGKHLPKLNVDNLKTEIGIASFGMRHNIKTAIDELIPDGPLSPKQRRLDEMGLPRRTQTPPKFTPPRLTTIIEVTEHMETAFERFQQYMDFLAEGKLDEYLNSNDAEDKVNVPEMCMSTDVNLLLNQLGERVDKARMEDLFNVGTTHLFNPSGSGKTRLSLDGLCHNWGFYFSCRRKNDPKTVGSLDVDVAISEILPELSTWDEDDHCRRTTSTSTERVLRMLLCVRVFLLGQLVRRTPKGTKQFDIRRRWVLLQTLPPVPSPPGEDIFVILLRSIRAGDAQVLKDFSFDKIVEMVRERPDLFPTNRDFFAIIDDTQDAAERPINCVPATTHSALHELYWVFKGSQILTGIILSGTVLSRDVVTVSPGSMFARPPDPYNSVRVFTDTGISNPVPPGIK